MSHLSSRHNAPSGERVSHDRTVPALFFALALCLLVAMPSQVDWIEGASTFAQPAFWPLVAVSFMVLFSALFLLRTVSHPGASQTTPGTAGLIRAGEYALWFIGYVLVVPWLGYLPATLLFTSMLTRRLGYRGWRWMLKAMIFSCVVVLIFKTVLKVKIPAGALYSALPDGWMRYLFQTYL